ncbi:hypothetical protein C2G38_2168564 [Gigaspora rosea]|uniref:t-SNARE coiled-coil homology domain-containing protein n=1 Tax=Gigaspora rosea TaxID=44941 RepID=A0A397VR77_9GLOM|nr:hypothetical protein C2G38_2168564 [Gigaspora rosea]
MSYTRLGTLFRTLSGRIPANQQEEFEYLSNSQQSESVSFVTTRSSDIPFDNPPIYQEAIFQTEVQQEVQQEDGLEFAHQTFINYEERIRSLESSIQTSNNQINCLETFVQTSNNKNKNLKKLLFIFGELIQFIKKIISFILKISFGYLSESA